MVHVDKESYDKQFGLKPCYYPERMNGIEVLSLDSQFYNDTDDDCIEMRYPIPVKYFKRKELA